MERRRQIIARESGMEMPVPSRGRSFLKRFGIAWGAALLVLAVIGVVLAISVNQDNGTPASEAQADPATALESAQAACATGVDSIGVETADGGNTGIDVTLPLG
ncbi:hypothetical protein [Mangrovihabitans endophyticus]|uniref:Uncharacterized protein n=1 Tax=Mangrovihabitans endophyticus TaxID=1751298 RepID=A0A8J3FSY2_9ACTN|nr:hypothetical protein [Mangrovihabitans endophyticus]GGL20104.1 hypothetical protein GCM10012284_63380 [Mangrovihabitans endophyticus]